MIKEISQNKAKKTAHFVFPAVLVFVVTLSIGVGLYVHTNRVMRDKMRQEMVTSAMLAAMQIPVVDLATIKEPSDMSKTTFRSIAATLNSIRDAVPNARFVGIFRRTNDPHQVQFVVDADAILSDQALDRNKNGIVDANERAAMPGEPYDISTQYELQGPAFSQPTITDVRQDEWGKLISAFAPLNTADIRGQYTLGIAMDAGEFLSLSHSAFSPAALMLIAFVAMLVAAYVALYLWRRKAADEQRIISIRSNIVRLAMHQLGAPLASMQWWLSILRDQEAVPLLPDKAEAFANLDVGLQRSQDLLSTLHRASSSASASLSNVDGVAVLSEVCEQVCAEMQSSLSAKKQSLTTDLGAAKSVRLQPALLKGVLLELVRNAIDYSPDNTSILLRATSDTHGTHVIVSDSGCGIPGAELSHIFGEFYRCKDATKYKPVGNGLGLYVCKNIIEAAGGHIVATSEVGCGTTIRFTLPSL